MYGYFANKSKYRLIVKNKPKYMAIYYKNRYIFFIEKLVSSEYYWIEPLTIYMRFDADPSY